MSNYQTLATAYIAKAADPNASPQLENTTWSGENLFGSPRPFFPLYVLWFPKTTDNGKPAIFGVAVAAGQGYDSWIRVLTAPIALGIGALGSASNWTTLGFDDDGGSQPTLATHGYVLPSSYPSNNAALNVTLDTSKLYLLQVGGYSTSHPNFAATYPTPGGGDLGTVTPRGVATVTGLLSGGKLPLGAVGAQAKPTAAGQATVSAYLQRLLLPGKAAKTLGNDALIVSSLETHNPRADNLGSATGAVTGPW